MIIKLFFGIILFYPTSKISAQSIDSVMNIYYDHFASEKLHIQTDRSVYQRGETVFYKAYLLSNNDLSGLSKTLYLDWYDDTGKLLEQTESPLLLSSSKGSFDIPRDYRDRQLHLCAYTKWMLNFDTVFIYRLNISIFQADKKEDPKARTVGKAATETQLQLYPEGGFSIAGLTNYIAFKATSSLGLPVNIKGAITNEKGNLLDSFTSVHDGMGLFSLFMENGKSYFLKWTDESGNFGQQEISAQKISGAILHVSQENKNTSFTIQLSPDSDKEFKNLHLLVHKNELLRYKFDIAMTSKTTITTPVDIRDLSTGIVQFTLFNASWIPIAERIIFVDNQNHFFHPDISITQKNLSRRGLNEIKINLTDTLLTNMSASVTDVSMVDVGGSTIFSDFLLSDEIKGNIYLPGYYFSSETRTDTIKRHLDLVMLTNGHRRFDWEQILKGALPSMPYLPDTSYLEIKGKLVTKKTISSKKPVTINLIVQDKDNVRKTMQIPVNSNGNFGQRNLFYYDTVKLFYSLSSGEYKGRPVEFENGLMKNEERKKYLFTKYTTGEYFSDAVKPDIGKSGTDYFFGQMQKSQNNLKDTVTLKSVTVSAKVKTKKQLLDDYYTRGMYSGEGNSIAIDVEGDIHAGSLNLWDYLQGKIPGLNVSGYPQPIPRWYPNSQGIPDVPAILLDEVPVSLGAVADININNIAYVKAFRPPFLGSMLNGFSGVIAIYSKRGFSPVYSDKNVGKGLETFLLKGYSKFREFTQPDYPNNMANNEPDNRPVLYWNPYILVDKENSTSVISFYNNDISKKLCLVIEGVNAEGKMTRIVKMLE